MRKYDLKSELHRYIYLCTIPSKREWSEAVKKRVNEYYNRYVHMRLSSRLDLSRYLSVILDNLVMKKPNLKKKLAFDLDLTLISP